MAIGRDRFAQGIVVRLFRAWSVLVDEGRSPLPRLQDIVAPLGLPDETAVACASLFELVEGHLGRRLQRECCCSQRFSRDERALLGVLELAPSLGTLSGTATVPHGLPAAIVWACVAIRRAFGMSDCERYARGLRVSHRCPFAAEPTPRESTHRA